MNELQRKNQRLPQNVKNIIEKLIHFAEIGEIMRFPYEYRKNVPKSYKNKKFKYKDGFIWRVK